MNPVKADLLKIISKTLKPEGFKRLRSTNWVKETIDCHLIINVQGSRLGGEVYLNVGCIVKMLPLQFPDSGLGYDNFHFWERFDGEKIDNCLIWGDGHEMTSEERQTLTVKHLQKTILPWLYSFSSLESIRKYFQQYTFYPHGIRDPKALGLTKPPKYQVITPSPYKGSVTILAGGSLPKWIPYTIFERDEETWRHYRYIDVTFETEESVKEWLRKHDQESLQCFIDKIDES